MIYLLVLFFHCVGGALIADSFTDFFGNQGFKGWYYKYNDGNNMLSMPNYGDSWVGGAMSWQQTDSWCQIGEGVMHTTTGGGLEACSTPNGYCAPVLLWVNPTPEINHTFLLTTSHTYPATTGRDGVIFTLKINGNVEETFTTPFTIAKNYGPYNIQNLQLILDPKNTCNNDGTNYRLQIYAPDPTPSPSPSYTPTPSITKSPSGVCHTIRSQLFGRQETVSGDGVVFTVMHGFNVTHNPPYEHCGANPTCVDLGGLCRCTYSGGSQNAGCASQRTTTITYSLGGSNSFSYNGQSPTCTYHMARNYMIPSITSTVTASASYTPTASFTPSPSATGICNEIKNYVNGKLEVVYDNVTQYNLFHGQYITSPYLPNFDMLIGVFNGCIEHGESCLCSYNRGYNIGCGGERSGLVNFTNGATFQTSYQNQSDCTFMFNASYIRPSATPSPLPTASITSSWTPTRTATASWTPTGSSTETPTATQTITSTQTPSFTSSQTPTLSGTVTPTPTATGICNDVRNFIFKVKRRDTPTAEYTIVHGEQITHYYYPGNNVLVGADPVCTDYGSACICFYNNGDSAFCPQKRQGIITYSYSDYYTTFLVNDTDPVCVYKFNTTFRLPYVSPSTTRSASATPSPSFVPPFVAGAVTSLPLPFNFPSIPNNASDSVLANIADGFVNSLGNLSSGMPGNHDLINSLNVLASSLTAVSANLSLELSSPGFTWVMTPAKAAAPISAGNVSAVLPALGDGLVYSFLATVPVDNQSLPSFSVDALGSANDKFKITELKTPLLFQIVATPPNGSVVECVYWNGTDWATDGCAFVNGSCACTHFTEFSARFAAIRDVNADLFSRASEVYSLSGFKKYGAIYGILIGLFIGISSLFIFLLRLDKRGEYKYRLAVEDIDEVCKVLGYNKPIVAQPVPALPNPNSGNYCGRFWKACLARLFYQHSYVGLFLRYDPRLPRGFRLLLLATVAFHTLFLSVLFYGYTKAGGEMTISESIVLSIITSALNIPFLRACVFLTNKIGIYEYTARFPDFSHEYYRRRAFENALRIVPTPEIVRIVNRLKAGKSTMRAVQVSPVAHVKHNRRGSVEYAGLHAYGETSTDAVIGALLERCLRKYRKKSEKGGIMTAIEIARSIDPHFETPSCNICPIKTVYGVAFSFASFAYIGWIMNYLLLFTASQSTSTMNSIASSFGISQATSILLTQPLSLVLTLCGSLLLSRFFKNSKNHIGYFVDPSFQKNSTSLSGNWAYWLFLYGGSVSSIGLNNNERPVGYSSTKVALEWVNGNHSVGISERDSSLTTLYVYLRGIEKPLTGRAAAIANAAANVQQLLEEAPHSSLTTVEKTTDEEAGELVNIVEEIANNSKDARLGIISESARNGSTH